MSEEARRMGLRFPTRCLLKLLAADIKFRIADLTTATESAGPRACMLR